MGGWLCLTFCWVDFPTIDKLTTLDKNEHGGTLIPSLSAQVLL